MTLLQALGNVFNMTIIAIDRRVSNEFASFHKAKMTKKVTVNTMTIGDKERCPMHHPFTETCSRILVLIIVICMMVVLLCYGRIATVALKRKRQVQPQITTFDFKLKMAKMLVKFF